MEGLTGATNDMTTIIIIVSVIVLSLLILLACCRLCRACAQLFVVCTPCGMFGIPCPSLGFYSPDSIKLRRVKMQHQTALSWSEAGEVVEEEQVSYSEYAARMMRLECDPDGNVIVPWEIQPSPYRIEMVPFLKINGMFGATVLKQSSCLGRMMMGGPVAPTAYELFCDDQGRPMLPYGVNAVRLVALKPPHPLNMV